MALKLIKIVIVAVIFIIVNATHLSAQVTLQGTVYANNAAKTPLPFTTIFNARAKQMLYTNSQGKYTIEAQKGDTIKVSFVGYFPTEYVVPNKSGNFTKNFFIFEKTKQLTEIKIDGRTKYQKDSSARAQLFEKPLGQEQVATMESPVTSLYQQFSKKYKDLRKFQQQYRDDEQQKYIDTKYTYDNVAALTKLSGDDIAYFMNAYPMEYKFARLASEVEIKLWIISNYKMYKKEKLILKK
jgi:CarboxypepD_reg-like domain